MKYNIEVQAPLFKVRFAKKVRTLFVIFLICFVIVFLSTMKIVWALTFGALVFIIQALKQYSREKYFVQYLQIDDENVVKLTYHMFNEVKHLEGTINIRKRLVFSRIRLPYLQFNLHGETITQYMNEYWSEETMDAVIHAIQHRDA